MMRIQGCRHQVHNQPIHLHAGVQVDGLSHVVHSEEEAMGTRITIDSLTCLLANESDPSRLVAMSPGKLIRYLVEDGAHVDMDQPYAEVEVRHQQQPICVWLKYLVMLQVSTYCDVCATAVYSVNACNIMAMTTPSFTRTTL